MTKTLHTHVDIEIARPTDAVWAVVSDYATDTAGRKPQGIPRVAGPVLSWWLRRSMRRDLRRLRTLIETAQ